MVFHWSLSDSKSPRISMILLSILAVLNNAVVWMISTRPPTSESSSPFNNPLVTVLKALITIDIIVTLMFVFFFYSLARSIIIIITTPTTSWFFLVISSSVIQLSFYFLFFSFMDVMFIGIFVKTKLMAF